MDGSIQERRNKDGKKVYDVYYRVLDPKTGKKKQKLKRGFNKKSLAQDFLNETVTNIRNNSYVETKKLLTKDFIEDWFKRFVENKLAPNTSRGYSVNIYKHIIPHLGNIPLQQLTTRDIQDFYDGILRADKGEEDEGTPKLSAKSIIYIHRNLCKALDYAVKDKLIVRNPSKDIDLPSPDKFTGSVYDQKTIIQLINAVKNSEMELPIALAGLSGLRRGECAGLLWSDIDFDNKIINVRKQRTSGGSLYARSKVKTLESYRSIRISNSLFEILVRHKQLQDNNKQLLGNDYKNNGFVCCNSDGTIVDPSVYSKRFTKVVKVSGLQPIRFHDLRHSFATNMIRLGVPVNTVSKMLGHSSPVITLTVYAHVLNEMQDEAVSKLDAEIMRYVNLGDEATENDKVEESLLGYIA